MPPSATAYVWAVIAAGVFAAASAVSGWECVSPPRFVTLLLLAIAGGAVKARLPGMTGTYSASFVFIVAAIPALGLSQMIAIAAATAIVQCVWQSKTAVRMTQLAFNVSNLILSTALAYVTWLRLGSGPLEGYDAARLAIGAVVYWAVNTGVLSIVLTLVGEGQFLELWRRWCLYSLPFHLGGGAIAILLSEPLRQGDWRAAILFAPVIVFVAKYYGSALSRGEPA